MLRLTAPALLFFLLTAINVNVVAKTPWSTDIEPEWLKEVMPEADTFSDKGGEPPVIRAYRTDADNGVEELVGYLYLSADVPPQEKGYSAPIDMLIGLSVEGHLTGLKVLNYVESYRYSRGDFLAREGFQAQFRNKSLNDAFRVRQDVDGVSNATISSWAISRTARDASRQVAKAYLEYEEGGALERTWAANAQAQLQQLSWQEMLDRGIVVQTSVPTPVDTELQLSITYIGRKALGEFFLGADAYARAERDASIRFDTPEMVMVAVGGTGSQLFRQERLSVRQGDSAARRVHPRRMVSAGNASEGKLAGQAEYAAGIVMDKDFDPTQPFTIIYQPLGSYEGVELDYQLSGVGLDLAKGEAILSLEQIEQARLAEAGFLTRLRHAPPWGDTPWGKVLMLLAIFALVMAAFLRKSSRLRWAALTVTLVYLGFIDGGFLSVSHITGAMAQGPSILLNNLPVLMIVVFTLVTTLLWGRVFCSSLCPFGALQDFLSRFTPRRWQVKMTQAIHDRALYIKYGILGLILITAVVQSDLSIFQYFEPFGTLFFFSSSLLLWSILIAILLASLVIKRFYCRYVCPLGAALGLLSLVSPLRIKRVPQCNVCKVCEQACPTGAIRGPAIDFKECVRCDICESKLITRAGTCRHSVEEIAQRRKGAEQVVKIMESPAKPA